MRIILVLILTILSICLLVLLLSDKAVETKRVVELPMTVETVPSKSLKEPNYFDRCPLANSFDFPVGPPDAKGYYNAQPFGKNNHLGDDWNGKGGGNTDLGDPVFAIGDGIVVFAEDIEGGWGNIVRIYHNHGTKTNPIFIESIYAHLNVIIAKKGAIIKKGQKLGTIGNANGKYLAHLHLEIRDKVGMSIGGGYSKNQAGYLDPTAFIKSHRRGK